MLEIYNDNLDIQYIPEFLRNASFFLLGPQLSWPIVSQYIELENDEEEKQNRRKFLNEIGRISQNSFYKCKRKIAYCTYAAHMLINS